MHTTANPAIQAVSDVVNIEAGSSGQLKVYVSGIPNPSNDSITWFKLVPGEGPIEVNEPTVNFSSDRRTLLLTNVTTNEIYQCLVSLSAFPRTAKINIPVNAVLLGRASIIIPLTEPCDKEQGSWEEGLVVKDGGH